MIPAEAGDLPRSPRPLRIAEVRARFLTAQVDDGIAMSFAPLRRRAMALLELVTEDGLIGYGESWINYPPWAITERGTTPTLGVAPLQGQDAADPAALRSRLLDALLPLGRQWGVPGLILQAISAADLALWDVVGKAGGTFAAEMAGGRDREWIPAHASRLGTDGVEEQAEQCMALGLDNVKVKLGFGRPLDEQNLRTARTILGDDAIIMVDANQAWSLPDALDMPPVLRDVGVAWVEEPLRGDRVAELAEFHRRTGLTVATGENLYQLDGFAGKIVLPHPYGGAHAYAATHQLATCSPEVKLIEYDIRHNPRRDPLLVKASRLVDGHVEIPDGLGLGVDLNLDRAAECEDDCA